MSEAASPTHAAARVLQASGIYFAIVFAVGLVLGPVRVLWLEPWSGKTIAVLLETPFLIAAMWFGAGVAQRLAKLEGGWPSLLMMGFCALAMQQIADLAVGFGLRGMTLNEQVAYFTTPPGYVYAASLIMFALAPWWRRIARRRRSMQ